MLVAALFLLPWLTKPRGPRIQTAHITAEPDAPPPLEVLPPPPPPEPLPPPPEPDTPLDREQPPDEDYLVQPDPSPLPPDELLPPIPSDPPPRPDRPEKRIIAVAPPEAPRAAPPPPVRPPPPPAPNPTKATPAPRGNRKPDYPRQAIDRNLQGRVLLMVEVRPDGSVGTIEVKTSSGHGILDQAAIRAVRDWTFTPATAQGRPVRSLVEVPIRFTLEG